MKNFLAIVSVTTTWLAYAVQLYAINGLEKYAVAQGTFRTADLPKIVGQYGHFVQFHGPLIVALLGTTIIGILYRKSSGELFARGLVFYHVGLGGYTLVAFAICVTPLVDIVNLF